MIAIAKLLSEFGPRLLKEMTLDDPETEATGLLVIQSISAAIRTGETSDSVSSRSRYVTALAAKLLGPDSHDLPADVLRNAVANAEQMLRFAEELAESHERNASR